MPSLKAPLSGFGWIAGIGRHWEAWRSAWREEQAAPRLTGPQGQEVEFLPAVLEIQLAPPSPLGRIISWTILALFTVAILWASFGKIDITAVARGRIIAGGHTKTIQSLESGVVTAIHVRDGQRVKKGEILLELDPTLTGADRERLTQEDQVALAETARLRALLTGSNTLGVIPGVSAEIVARQAHLLQDQLNEHQARLSAGNRIVEQRQAALQAAQADILRLEQVVPIVSERAQAYKALKEGGHASLLEYSETERERIERVQELAGARQRQIIETAALAEAQNNLQAITAEFAKLTRTELAQAETRALALSKELVKATHTDQRQRLTAPVDGTVQQLAVHTVGGVVTPAQPLLVVVPDEDQLEVEAWVENKDIGFVDAGQKVEIKVDAFPFTRYGMIEGEVLNLSKDAVQLEDVGYVFAARARMDKAQIAVENGKVVNLSPGMTVAVEIRTGERRLIEYLLSPVLKAVGESGRER